MRGLKILVVVMGVMLVGGIAVLVAAITYRASHPRSASLPFDAAAIELAAGARIEAMSVDGDRLVAAILMPDGNRQLLVIDLVTGRRLGLIPLRTAP